MKSTPGGREIHGLACFFMLQLKHGTPEGRRVDAEAAGLVRHFLDEELVHVPHRYLAADDGADVP